MLAPLLHVRSGFGGAFREDLHGERASAQVWHEVRRDASVVVDELTLGESDVGKDDALGMCDGYFGVVHREVPSEGAEWSGMAERDGHPVVKVGTRRVLAVLTGTILVAVIAGMTSLGLRGHRQLDLKTPAPRVAATVVSVHLES